MQRTEQPSMFFGAKRNIFQKAEFLRNNMTEAERMLWNRLSKNQLGVRFKAQHPIDIFIADFYCHKHKLIIEIDGDIHNLQQDYDLGRTAELEALGLKVIRFTNNEVFNQIEKVIEQIKRQIDAAPNL